MFRGHPTDSRKRPSIDDDRPPKKQKTSSSTAKAVSEWTTEEVKDWWKNNLALNCQKYLQPLVIDNELNGDDLISADFLKEILNDEDVSGLHKKKIIGAIDALKITEQGDQQITAQPPAAQEDDEDDVEDDEVENEPLTVPIPQISEPPQIPKPKPPAIQKRETSNSRDDTRAEHVKADPLLVDGKRGMQIFVRNMSENDITLLVLPTFKVSRVKRMIQDREGVRIDQIRLIFGGKQLKDEANLAAYNIHKGCTLHMVLRLLGGYYWN